MKTRHHYGFNLIISLLIGSSYAITPLKSHHTYHHDSIIGYPLGRHQDYTINGPNHQLVKIRCDFTNQSPQSHQLELWTEPNAHQPYLYITLKPGTKPHPFKSQILLRLRLFHHWWCGIYLKSTINSKPHYCAYFSIGDKKASPFQPFALHIPSRQSKNVSFSCHINSSPVVARFFAPTVS